MSLRSFPPSPALCGGIGIYTTERPLNPSPALPLSRKGALPWFEIRTEIAEKVFFLIEDSDFSGLPARKNGTVKCPPLMPHVLFCKRGLGGLGRGLTAVQDIDNLFRYSYRGGKGWGEATERGKTKKFIKEATL